MSASRIYYIFTACLALGMGATVTAYAPFLESLGLTLAQIALLNTIFWVVVIASEIPSGMVADGRSRAFSLTLGSAFYAMGAMAYVFAVGFWSAVLGEVLIGIGGAFVSGAGTAWIADALHREARSSELRDVYATEALIRAVMMMLGGFLGSVIAKVFGAHFIWIPFALMALTATYVAYWFMNGQGEPMEHVSEREAFKRACSLLMQSYALRWLIMALVVFGAVVSFNHYWSLFFLPHVGQLGLAFIWPVMYLGVIGGSQIARHLKTPVGQEGEMIVVALALTGLGLFGVALSPSLWFTMPALVVHEVGRGLFQPLTESFVQHRVHTSYRATFGSLQSFLGRMGFVVVPLVVSFVIKDAPNTPSTIGLVWFVCAVCLILGASVLWLTRPKS